MSLLKVNNLEITDKKTNRKIVSNLSFELQRNTCLGIVGESGSGKSVTVKSILSLLPSTMDVSGSVIFDDMNLFGIKYNELRKVRGKRICMILQDPMSAFNPLYSIGHQMIETIIQNKDISKKEAKDEAIEALKKMSLYNPEELILKYPHQLSGGMLQRCIIALAMSMKPDIIIADEPTTALDSINQSDVINEFKKLITSNETSVIFISHDLAIIKHLAHNVLVMKDGIGVEYGDCKEIFENPKDDYTKYLVNTRIEMTSSFKNAKNVKERAI